ncbi:glutathione-independent formaldehyde dehydrogenase [Dyella sedimenti]|uniref:glutathione-independent formaldehyde dehydrogenase n=1 Tax=Dyella sedimenti TaxID=2919947 RepID=UPI001FAB2D0F|nr:glutathione-independent formaldehyde dehydrogenase [Dyella sedimenti]
MKAVVYQGPRDVRVIDVPDARIEKSTDVLVRITTTNICGSDLHMYDGRTEVEAGQVLGHENLGEVIEVGEAVDRVKVGDLVCLPFNVSCGFCENCERGLTGFCLTVNPGKAGGAYGYAGMGPYRGGQAELLRVPYGDFNCLVLPEGAREQQNDYVMLSDIFPTGYHATELAGVQPGESVVIYGAGPVGLLAAHSAFLRGASRVFVVDTHKDRLAIAEKLGAIAIDDTGQDGADQVVEQTGGGADRGCECVGYQCFHGEGHEVPNLTMNNLVTAVRATGSIGVVGVFMPKDPGGADALARKGQIAFDIGQFFTKGQRMGTGQCNVKAYNRHLCRLIEAGKARPSVIVSHELPLAQAAEGYRHFDAREEGWTKVVLKPGG